MLISQPMLAAKITDVAKLRFPLIASPKVDGIRCVIVGGVPKSRKLLDIPNRYIFDTIRSARLLDGIDGELIVGSTFQQSTSGIMSRDGEPRFTYHVFDIAHPTLDYCNRLQMIRAYAKGRKLSSWLCLLPMQMVRSVADLEDYEAACLANGYEGVCLRDPYGRYKQGRSTFKEHGLLKLKRFEDSEGTIIGAVEQRTNTNEATRDNTGSVKRSSAKAGRIANGKLGAFVVQPRRGESFEVGTGFSDAQRKEFWRARKSMIGQLVKYRYQPHGMKDRPRCPVFLGLRAEGDL